MLVSIRPFKSTDIANKVKWINDTNNNRYLHYDLPLEEEKTRIWFEKNKNRKDRFDAVIEVDGFPVGLIGLLQLDERNKKAEYYVCLGEQSAKGKGVAFKATELIFKYAFDELGLNKIYLYTEVENVKAQKLFERIGFEKEGLLKEDILYCGKKISRFCYGITREKYLRKSDSD